MSLSVRKGGYQTGKEDISMMYPYLTLNDQTEITHSEMKEDGSVKVYIETPDENGGFHSAVCWLPEYRWENIQGYTEEEMSFFRDLVRNNAHLMLEFSQDGGVLRNGGTTLSVPQDRGMYHRLFIQSVVYR